MPFDLEKGVFARPKSNRRLLFLSALVAVSFVSLYILFHPTSRIEFHKSNSFPLPLPKFTSHHPPAEPQPRTHPACEIWPGWRTTIPQAAAMHKTDVRTSLGSAEFLGGSDERACVPASERLVPFGRAAEQPAEGVEEELDTRDGAPDWSSLRWGEMQSNCAAAHFDTAKEGQAVLGRRLAPSPPRLDDVNSTKPAGDEQPSTGRTAVVLRTWDSYQYSAHQMAWLRALIAELAMDTGGEFQVFFLVDVKDAELDLLGDDDAYRATLERTVPAEFRDMALLYNAPLLQRWYPKVGEHGAQDQMYQALQIFSHSFPEFDFLWQLEMDLRLTGNVADMLAGAGRWAAAQPRRNLWERNGQFFIPGLWNGSYAAFAAHVDAAMGDDGVWGPAPHARFFVDDDPAGPAPPPRSRHAWGVGEPAELLTLAPLIDPVSTHWTYERAVRNWGGAELALPRRMAMVSVTRTSRRLLRLVSHAQRRRGAMLVSEATPESWAFLHGLKAVYVPHYVAFNIKAPGQFGPDGEGRGALSAPELDAMLHRGPPWSRAGGERASFLYCADDGGLPESRWLDASYFYWQGEAQNVWWAYTNGTCGPPMVLHPVKTD